MTERPRFPLRLPPELDALVIEASKKAGRSKNAVIVEALEWRFRPDAALHLAEVMRPLLENLNEEQRTVYLELTRSMVIGGAARKRRLP